MQQFLIILPIFIIHVLILSFILFKSAKWLEAKQYNYKNILTSALLITISEILFDLSIIIYDKTITTLLACFFFIIFVYLVKKYFVLDQKNLIFLFLICVMASMMLSDLLYIIFLN